MERKSLKQFTYKKFGLINFGPLSKDDIKESDFQDYIKVLFLKSGAALQVDFEIYNLKTDALFFINSNQSYELKNLSEGSMIFYNRDFYCVEIHDKEVSCDGILYNNVYDIPLVILLETQSLLFENIFKELNNEMDNNDNVQEEMLRIMLKEIIIRSTRLWTKENSDNEKDKVVEIEFLRQFSRLVEIHFRNRHSVAEYAVLLNITPKALNKRIHKYGKATPNEIIKNRIILEAKRRLIYSKLSVKEIAYSFGFKDPAYFNRLFTKISGLTPVEFKRDYYAGAKSTIQVAN